MKKQLLLLVLLTCFIKCQDVLSTVDFLYQSSYTGAYFKSNYVGLVLNFSQVYTYYNTTNFQGYVLNSNLKGDWKNNFLLTLRMPQGWYYDCAAAGVSVTNTTACKFQIKGNLTWFNQLGQFVKNTQRQPYWTMGLNNQKLRFTNSTLRNSLYNYFYRLYVYSFSQFYTAEMMYQGDKAIENGMKTGTNYTYANFLSQAFFYSYIYSQVTYKGPGVSQTATLQWYENIPGFLNQLAKGIFSFQPVIFTNISLATIENLLNENYTQGYFKRRFYVNSSFSYTNFTTIPTSLARVRLTSGLGIDNVTNTFAAAIWWIDFLIQGALYCLNDIGIQASAASNNFQSAFGSSPAFAPSALYYGSIMAILAGQSNAQIVVPSLTIGTSANIKVWGFQSAYLFKILILNKDTNTSQTGVINIRIKSSQNEKMKCIYMKAGNLTSKADNMTIGGYSYIGGNSTPQGNFSYVQYSYDANIQGFAVSIKYAQIAVCQTTNGEILIPLTEIQQDNYCKYVKTVIISFLFLLVAL